MVQLYFSYCFFRMWLSIRGVISPNKCVTPELGKAKLWCHGAGNFENRKFYEILTLVTSEGVIFNEFSSLTRISLPCGARLAYYYVTRRAVLPKSNTGTGVIGRVRGKNRFNTFGVFNLEFLEICEFVRSNRIFLQVFSVNAFDSCRQIAKRI